MSGFTEEELRAMHGDTPKKGRRKSKVAKEASQEVTDSVASLSRLCPDKYINAGIKLADERLKADATQALALVKDSFEQRYMAGRAYLDEQIDMLVASLDDLEVEPVYALPDSDFSFLALGVAR